MLFNLWRAFFEQNIQIRGQLLYWDFTKDGDKKVHIFVLWEGLFGNASNMREEVTFVIISGSQHFFFFTVPSTNVVR